MNWYNLYWKLPNDNKFGIFGKIINRTGRKFIRKKMNSSLPSFYKKNPIQYGLNTNKTRKNKIICSITSFPGRIDKIWVSLETILRQSYKPDKIILWLAESQFPDRHLPDSLLKLEERGLSIRYVDDDLRSHKKYFYALQEYKDDLVILLDDDLYYPEGLIQNLIDMSIANPHAICATRVHKMTYKKDELLPYKRWIHNYNKNGFFSDSNLFFTSGAGTLIPPGAFNNDVFNDTIFKNICFLADDVWLNFQARKNGTKIISNNRYDKDEISTPSSQNEKLVTSNVAEGGNDKQISEVKKYLNL